MNDSSQPLFKIIEDYPSSVSDDSIISIYKELMTFIRSVYKYIEPELTNGEIVITKLMDDVVPFSESGLELIDLSDLLRNDFEDCFLMFPVDETSLPLFWPKKHDNLLELSNSALIYRYTSEYECLYFRGKTYRINRRVDRGSVFADHFFSIRSSLNVYREKSIRNSTCEIFRDAWFDENRYFFINKPEDIMQLSLKNFLHANLLSRFKEVDVKREYNTDSKKPIDIRVLLKNLNRAAIIEVKWLGTSVNEDSTDLGTGYSNSRAVDGIKQTMDYYNRYIQEHPSDIVEAFLIVIDGRRWGNSSLGCTLSNKNAFHYCKKEITVDKAYRYFDCYPFFNDVFRMFAESIYQ